VHQDEFYYLIPDSSDLHSVSISSKRTLFFARYPGGKFIGPLGGYFPSSSHFITFFYIFNSLLQNFLSAFWSLHDVFVGDAGWAPNQMHILFYIIRMDKNASVQFQYLVCDWSFFS